MRFKKLIPNIITSMNLLCGVVGVIFTFNGRPDAAFIAMLAAAAADFLDGFTARALNVRSAVGKELDSLCDVVSFGVLPSVMLHVMAVNCCGKVTVWSLVPLLIAVFSAVRLARFNLDERQHGSFIGLPTPACAMLCGSLVCFIHESSFGLPAPEWTLSLLSTVLCVLLVSEVPMFSFKFGRGIGPDRKAFRLRTIFLVIACVCVLSTILLHAHWSMAVMLTFLAYILENLVVAAISAI